VLQLLVTANIVHRSLMHVILMIEAEMSVLLQEPQGAMSPKTTLFFSSTAEFVTEIGARIIVLYCIYLKFHQIHIKL
jgi:hypothetical protein